MLTGTYTMPAIPPYCAAKTERVRVIRWLGNRVLLESLEQENYLIETDLDSLTLDIPPGSTTPEHIHERPKHMTTDTTPELIPPTAEETAIRTLREALIYCRAYLATLPDASANQPGGRQALDISKSAILSTTPNNLPRLEEFLQWTQSREMGARIQELETQVAELISEKHVTAGRIRTSLSWLQSDAPPEEVIRNARFPLEQFSLE